MRIASAGYTSRPLAVSGSESTVCVPHPLRIALWAPLPPPLGGVSRWTLRFREAAPAQGLDVRVVDVAPRVRSVDERSRFDLDRLAVAWRALRELGRVVRSGRPDLCHVTTTLFWATPRDALALVLCRLHGVPTVLHVHASSQIVAWREGLHGLRRRGLDRMLRLADVVLVLSHELEAYLRAELPGLRVARIGNMVEVLEPGASAGPVRVLPERRAPCRVLFVGHRTPKKGLAELAEAVLGLPDCELAVVGGEGGGAIDPGADRRMQEALARLRAAGRLVETGELPPELVTDAYREADVFALPSHREGFPNTLLEAMAAGLPCVSTPVGAIPEMLRDGCGELVPVGDAQALRAVLERLARTPAERARIGDRGRRRIAERYGIDTVMRQYRALYERLLDGSEAPASPGPRTPQGRGDARGARPPSPR
jgi:glycosyltransferase involved in cell wall biosynthesis